MDGDGIKLHCFLVLAFGRMMRLLEGKQVWQSGALLCRSAALEIQSEGGAVHFRATFAAEPANAASDDAGNTSQAAATVLAGSRKTPACNWAALAHPEVAAAAFYAHPGLGDCVIHLGTVPKAGQELITR